MMHYLEMTHKNMTNLELFRLCQVAYVRDYIKHDKFNGTINTIDIKTMYPLNDNKVTHIIKDIQYNEQNDKIHVLFEFIGKCAEDLKSMYDKGALILRPLIIKDSCGDYRLLRINVDYK